MSENPETWYKTEVQLQPIAVEAIEFALIEAGADGTELNLLGKNPHESNSVCLIGYFAVQPVESEVREHITNALEIYNLPSNAIENIDFKSIENQDWLAEWKKHWQPTVICKFIVAPPWSEIFESPDNIVLRIEPGMAFGTGTHETTRLCLKAIEANLAENNSFLDVGTGTGVLAMAAAKIKFKFEDLNSNDQKTKIKDILACDTDADSIKIAAENAALNGVADKIEFYVGSIDKNTVQFDFVCANLTADVIVPLLPLLIEKTKKTLVLSGILHEQQAFVENELRKLSDSVFEVDRLGEWISLTIENA